MESTADLVGQLEALGLVSPVHRAAFRQLSDAHSGDPGALINDLQERGYITAAQAEVLYAGRPESLRLGDFVLVEQVGEGGMGKVYKGRHYNQDEFVCIKVVHPELASSNKLVRRFQRERKALSEMQSQYVVTAYNEGESNGKLYYVMEFVDGVDLGKLILQKGPLPYLDACRYIKQAALGLQAAHSQGIVHRDIKPDNFLLDTTKDQVKLLDLGLCRVEDAGGENLTVAGTALGTAEYMAPEQIRDSTLVDPRADLYALGCTFYYLLTGKDPFRHRNPAMVMQMQLTQEPEPIEQSRPEVPASVIAIVKKLMMKKAEDRFATAAEIVTAIDKVLKPGQTSTATGRRPASTGTGLKPPTVTDKRSSKAPAPVGEKAGGGNMIGIVVGAIVVLALAGAAVWYFVLRG